MPEAFIEALDHEGRGVAHVDGKATFIEGAVPGERVEYTLLRSGQHHAIGATTRVLTASAQRVEPRCEYFGQCGGCALQHVDFDAQTASKQRVLEDALRRIGKVRAERLYAPIHGQPWGYRGRARLSVRLLPEKGGVFVGFHARKSSHIVDMRSCAVLPPSVSALLPQLRELIAGLSIADRVPQVEIAVGAALTVFVFRHLLPFSVADRARLQAFGAAHGIQVWHQPGGPESATPLNDASAALLAYSLPEFGVQLEYRPTDFTQVNVAMNRVLVRRALQLLAPRAGEHLADLFCGMGNFSLPMARSGATVVGIEGSAELVARATANARANGLDGQCRFHALDLFDTTADSLAALGRFDKILLDPPREGAIAVVKALDPRQLPGRIVYVSCNPATLARDAAVLVHDKGYRLRGAGIANMFPHTAHVESIAVFERAAP